MDALTEHNVDNVPKIERQKNQHQQLKRTTFSVLITVLLFLMISAGIGIWRQYENAFQVAELKAQNLAERTERWIIGPLRFFDTLPLETLAQSKAAEAAFFDQIINRSNRFYAAQFLNNENRVIKQFGSAVSALPKDIWQASNTIKFGEAMWEPTIQNWLIPIRHPLRFGPDKLSALVYLDGRAFDQFYKTIHPQGNGSISLFRSDGVMLARIPFTEKMVGKDFSKGKLFSEILLTEPEGVTRPPKTTDGIERIVAHKALESYPLVLTIGMNIETLLDDTIAMLIQQSLPFIGIILVALIFARFLWRQVKAAERAQNDLIRTENELRRMAFIDPLTGCLNRRAFLQNAIVEHARYRRNATPYCCVMVDLDKFKSINDHYGHSIGDEILHKFVEFCKERLRAVDFIGRYGGEEFVLFLPETPLGPAIDVAERLRKDLSDSGIHTEKGKIPTTFSAGIACIQSPDENIENLLKRADSALYKAKQGGRNKVVADESVPFI